MFEKVAEDLYKATIYKIAQIMEKEASKWGREMVRRFGDNFTIGDLKKMYNAAYTEVSPSRVETQYSEKIKNLINSIKDKKKHPLGLPPGKREMLHNILDNRKKLNSPEIYRKKFDASDIDESLPAQKYFDFIDSFLNADTAKKLKGYTAKQESVAKSFRRAGGKNPVIKGLQSRDTSKNINKSTNISNIKNESEGNRVLRYLDQGPELEALKSIGGVSDLPSERVSFFSGYGPMADIFSRSGNYSVGNLDNIIKDLQQRDIRFSPDLGSYNLKYRNMFDDTARRLYGMPLHTHLKNKKIGLDNPLTWRKAEIPIPETLIDKLNANGFHVFDTNDRQNIGLFSKGVLKRHNPSNQSRSNLKNFLKTKRAKEMQAIPVEDFYKGRDLLHERVNSANTNTKDLLQHSNNYTELEDYLRVLDQSGIDIDKIDWLKPFRLNF